MEFLRARIRVREHGDLQRLAQEAAAIDEKFDNETSARNSAFAYVMSRDFEGARRVLGKVPDGPVTPMGLSNKQFDQLMVAHFLGEKDRVAELSALARDNLAQRGEPFEEIEDYAAMTLAALAALEGDTAGAERYLRQYYRGSGTDWAYRSYNRDFTCQILGMAGAAEATVRCLRDGLAEPSYVIPFLEPYLSFYDPVREAPAFVEFVAELERP